jgi:excisionase family DNA binding protein
MSEVLTVRELAGRFRVSQQTVRRAIKTGRLRATKIGGDGTNAEAWNITLEDAQACFGSPPPPALKALYSEFLAAKSGRLAANAAEATAERAN